MKITVEMVVHAPREKVFARAMDLERWPGAIAGIERVELLTPGPVRVGTRFRETRQMYGREASEEMTFAEIVPPERFVLTAENHGAQYRAVHEFVAEGEATRMRLEFGGTPVSLAAKLFTPLGWLFSGHIRKLLEADLADLKRAIEQQG